MARIRLVAERGVGRASVRDDPGDVGQRLDVVDDRRRAVEALDGGKRRLVARISLLPLERVDEARLLAAHVGAAAAVNDDVARECAAENALADEPGGTRLLQRPAQPAQRQVELAADVHERMPRMQREGGEQDAFDELMRSVLEDPAVLERSRLAFVGVAAQVHDRALLVHERPLRAHRKVRPAPAAQPGGGDLPLDVLRLQRAQRLPERLVAAARAVRIERVRVARDREAHEHVVGAHALRCQAAHRRSSRTRSTFASSSCSW